MALEQVYSFDNCLMFIVLLVRNTWCVRSQNSRTKGGHKFQVVKLFYTTDPIPCPSKSVGADCISWPNQALHKFVMITNGNGQPNNSRYWGNIRARTIESLQMCAFLWTPSLAALGDQILSWMDH